MTQSKHKLSARSVCLRSARRFGPVTVCWCSTLCANEWADDKWQTPCAVCICFSPINTTFILCVWGGIPMLKLALVCVGTYAGQLQCSYVHCCCSSSCLERSQRHSLTSPQTLWAGWGISTGNRSQKVVVHRLNHLLRERERAPFALRIMKV